MDSEQKKLVNEQLKTVGEILYKHWDPIGVYGIEEARDEYTSYAPRILSMVLEGCSARKLAVHLTSIEVKRMAIGQSVFFRSFSKPARKTAKLLLEKLATND